MNLRGLIRKALRRLSGRSGTPAERKARRAAKRGDGPVKKKRRRGGGAGSRPSPSEARLPSS